MRWLARLTVAVTLSGIAVVALTVAGWPRPRAVVRIGTSSQVILRNDFSASDGRHRLIQQTGANASFWFLAADGTLLGPWQPGRTLVSRGFDTVGRLLADTPDLDYQSAAGLTCRTYELVRYDPATGREEVVHARPDVLLFGVRLSRDLSTLALATLGDPLTFITYDVATGRQQHIVKVPGRVGSLDPRQALVAACCWDLTPDGQGLVLAGGWDGDRRPDRLGVDVLETASGRMKRRIDLVAPVISPDVGVCYFHFASDGRSVSCGLESRVPAVWTSGWTQGWVVSQFAAQRPRICGNSGQTETPPRVACGCTVKGTTSTLVSCLQKPRTPPREMRPTKAVPSRCAPPPVSGPEGGVSRH